MSHFFRGLLICMLGAILAAIVIGAITACGNIDTPLPATTQSTTPPHCPPDVVSNPQPVYPAN